MPNKQPKIENKSQAGRHSRHTTICTYTAAAVAGLLLLGGCTISQTTSEESESDKQKTEFEERNAKYSANNNDGAEARDSIRWVDRTEMSPLVLVAPHATNHHRAGHPKVADLYTGAITEMVADNLKASALTTTGPVSDWNDNWKTRDDGFTHVLKNLPTNTIVIELHGMDDSSSNEPVSVGTGDRPSPATDAIIGRLSENLSGQVDIDGGFNAQASYTVTDFMQKRGHSAMQIEMNHALRDPKQGQTATSIARLSRTFQEVLSELPSLSTKPTREKDADEPNIDNVRESSKQKPSHRRNSTSLKPAQNGSSAKKSSPRSTSQRSRPTSVERSKTP